MMKAAGFVFTLLIGTSVFASSQKSLMDVLNSQELLTISPVQFEGHPVIASSDQAICHLAGYTTLRNSEKQTLRITEATQYAYIDTSLSSVSTFRLNTVSSGVLPVLKSVTCGR